MVLIALAVTKNMFFSLFRFYNNLFQKLKELEGNVIPEDGKVPFLTYLMSQSGLTAEEALCTATDLLVGATETVSRDVVCNQIIVAYPSDRRI